jgi:RNA polymerase sigma-70 factor (ECF subfamily)
VHALPQEQREAFVLKEDAGLSVEQIAKVTDVNAETAKSRLRYAVRKIREGLKDFL